MDTEFWKEQRVLVTGATGLVGSWLVKDLLAHGANVTALVRDWNPQAEFIRNDIYRQCTIVCGALEDCFAVERAIVENEISIVIHLAAQAIVSVAERSPLQTFEANIRGSYNIMDACRQHKGLVKALVVASSDKAYGSSAVLPYLEDHALVGVRPYEVSKTCTDLLAQSYFQSYGVPVAIGRCGNIYGGGDLNWSRIVPGTIRSIMRAERPILRSDGKFIRDYIYVRDVSSAYMRMAEAVCKQQANALGQAFNFSPEKPFTVLEIVSEIQNALNRHDLEPVILNQAQSEIRDQYLDASKALRVLNWKANYSISEGMAETVKWYADFLGAELNTKHPIKTI